MNNTPVVCHDGPCGALPAQHYTAASKLLLPVSYSAVLGGTVTLIGTEHDILVSDLYLQAGGPGSASSKSPSGIISRRSARPSCAVRTPPAANRSPLAGLFGTSALHLHHENHRDGGQQVRRSPRQRGLFADCPARPRAAPQLGLRRRRLGKPSLPPKMASV